VQRGLDDAAVSSTLQIEMREKGLHFLSCPVFGPPEATKTAHLLVAVAGDTSAKGVSDLTCPNN
jgi:3-hydroxyisobutyrate dehydrogenase-like beta-hydroxyacid dehydrogenase